MKGSKLDLKKEEFEKLFNEGLSDYKIAKILGLNHCTVFQWRKKHGYIRKSLKEAKYVPLNSNNLQVLMGTILGDGNLQCNYTNPRYINSHGPKQAEYSYYIAEQFANLGAKVHYSKRNKIDERTGIYYEEYACITPANPAFLNIYKLFYRNGTKVIPTNSNLFRENFTEKSLAFLYMDDGNKAQCGYCIATMCFTEDEITEFRKFLFTKFNIETTMYKDKRIRVRARSAKHFKELVLPYMHHTMLYKL